MRSTGEYRGIRFCVKGCIRARLWWLLRIRAGWSEKQEHSNANVTVQAVSEFCTCHDDLSCCESDIPARRRPCRARRVHYDPGEFVRRTTSRNVDLAQPFCCNVHRHGLVIPYLSRVTMKRFRATSFLSFTFVIAMFVTSASAIDLASEAAPGSSFSVAEGFKVERLYSVPSETQGSWVSLTVDDFGRLITSDQYGKLYRVTPPSISGKETLVEPIDLDIGPRPRDCCMPSTVCT